MFIDLLSLYIIKIYVGLKLRTMCEMLEKTTEEIPGLK